MSKKIGLSDVKIEWLNKRALVLISIFSHAAHKLENQVIDLRSGDVLSKVSDLAKTSGNAELIDIYSRIKREIKVSLSEKDFSVEAAREVAKLSVYDSLDEVYDRNRPL